MVKFRTRQEELKDQIKLYTLMNNPEIVVDNSNHSFHTVRRFILKEIETLSSSMISLTINHPCVVFAYDIAIPLFEFDRQLFAAIFQEAVDKNYLQVGFDRILKIVCGFQSIEMSIVGCRVAYGAVNASFDNQKQEKCNRLSAALNKFTQAECDALAADMKIELTNLLSSLGE